MSVYFSKFLLNTYSGTPYFQAHVPEGYPISPVLQKCRAFRRLPPNLRKLSALSKRWAARSGGAIADIEAWYDAAGNELDPGTGVPLTDEQIDAQWSGIDPPDVEVTDIPVPDGGFPDPETWIPPEPGGDADEDADEGDDRPTEAQVRADVASHGLKRAAQEYGISDEELSGIGSDDELIQAVLNKRG